jgi:hypothetical protein
MPNNSGHPLLEARTNWLVRENAARYEPRPAEPAKPVDGKSGLTLQLTAEPKQIIVETVLRRDHFAPARFRDASGWHEVVQVAGPDRVSGGRWDSDRAYAREYFRCVTREGSLVWIFRAARGRQGAWYLHGWWD